MNGIGPTRLQFEFNDRVRQIEEHLLTFETLPSPQMDNWAYMFSALTKELLTELKRIKKEEQ